jgi:hypothetical protein
MRLITARSSTRRNSRGLGFPACGLWRQGADLDEAEAEHLPKGFGIQSKPAASPTGLGKQAGPHLQPRIGPGRPPRRQQFQRPDRRAMRTLGVQREGQRPDERVERHRSRL